MSFDLFSCCWPAGGRDGKSKVSCSQLQQNGISDTREARGYCRRLEDDDYGCDVQSSQEALISSEKTFQDVSLQEARDCRDNRSPRERVIPTAPVAVPQRSCPPPAPTSRAEGSSTRATTSVPAFDFPSVRPQAQRGGYGPSIQPSGPDAASTMRPARTRMIHAHPKDHQLQSFLPGANSRVGSSRGRTQVTSKAEYSDGRVGPISIAGAEMAVARGPGARGPQRAVPGAPDSVLEKYEMKEVLGVGSTSKCYRCVNKSTRKEFACKVIDKKSMDPKLKPLLSQFHVEVQVLRTLRHPNIIHMESVFESETNICMVMELMLGGELFDYVVKKGTLSEQEASVMVRKVTSALAYMHSLDIIHRDLKPENLLLTSKGPNPEVKVIDFGLAKVLGAGNIMAQSFLGTRGYLAPEMLQRQSYTKAVDVWALGVIVFVLLCGCLPFDDDSKRLNRAGAMEKFVLRFPKWANNLSPGAKNLLSQLLTVSPDTRITAQEALEHPWVTGQTAAPDNFLASPRTLRKLSLSGITKGPPEAGKSREMMENAREAAMKVFEARRRAEFEEQLAALEEDSPRLSASRLRKNSL